MAKHFMIYFLEVHGRIKLLHWNTTSYAEHVALDKLTESFASLTDKFVEVFIGKYGRPKLPKRDLLGVSLEYNVDDVSGFLDELGQYFVTDLNKILIPNKDADLINIRDELVAAVHQTKYLVTLR